MASHASSMENFSTTRLTGVARPSHPQGMVDCSGMVSMTPKQSRELIGDGNFGDDHKPDDVMDALWRVEVEETRELLQGPWQKEQFAPESR